jgi:hypothetical protein
MPAFRRFLFAGVAVVATVIWSAGPAGAGGSDWHVGYYTPSPHGALSFASADLPAGGIATLNFTSLSDTALLVTDHGSSSLVGDDRGMVVSATFEISNVTGAFTYFGEPDGCGTPANTRLFFQTSNAGGFNETHYWWSNPVAQTLVEGKYTVMATVNGAEWSDFFGHFGNDPAYAEGFNDAAANVTTIGMSFGGGCFFENGVGTSDGSGTFTLDSFSVVGS